MSKRARGALLLVAVALGGCARPGDDGAETAAATGVRFLAAGAVDGFARAMAPRAFVFPEDHGSHPGFRTEWWYFTGNVQGADARHYGFELTFFRIALAPGPVARESRWAAHEVWMAHFALTDTAAQRFVAHERLSRGALGLAGATHAPFRVWVEDWSATASAEPGGPVRLKAAADGAAIDLELNGFERIVAQGERGLDAKGPEPGNASYYYSAPRLTVRGTAQSAGRPPEPVTGLAWMDREWSTSALSPGLAGWDWFALQLDDGRDLMYYRLRHDDGSTSPFSGGSLTDAAGRTRRLEADDVVLEALESWLSAASGASYPVAWRMRIPDAGLELRIVPRLADQELRLSVRYWEGAVEVGGRDGSGAVGGQGYLELAGY